MKQTFSVIFAFILFTASLHAQTATLTVLLYDSSTRQPVPDVAVYVQDGAGKTTGSISDESGQARLRVMQGAGTLQVSHVAYRVISRPIVLHSDTVLRCVLQGNARQLREVVVTGSESKRISSTTHIGRDAMQHLQPTSLSDLMELLPGGISQTPQLTQANTIELRETGTLGALGQNTRNDSYATNSLGTLMVVDGAPLNTDANLQQTPENGTAESQRNTTNRGVDLRSIGTDDIESVEIIRGIPSAEYGNLTSGVMNIKKIRRPTQFNARFKADDRSQLLAMGKGFALDSAKQFILNADGSLLNAYADPRNPLENYKRVSLSVRLTAKNETEHLRWMWTPIADYTGSFDDSKTDPSINYGGIDTYTSRFQRIALGTGLQLVPRKNNGHFRKVETHVQVSQQFDLLDRQRLVAPQRAGIAPSSIQPGEYDAYLLLGEYVARYQVDGKPFTAFAKMSANWEFCPWGIRNALSAGGEWNLAKNFGEGPIYDLSHPLSASGWGARPRSFASISAVQTLGLYAQDQITAHAGNHTIDVRAGVRTTAMPGLSKLYAMHGRAYADPRLNAQWTLPAIGKRHWTFSLSAGIGWTSKMPTLDYLYPEANYVDIIQMGYYNTNDPANLSRYNIVSYRQDATNYALQPARNRKWEIRLDANMGENRLWVCFFSEKMSSGFRYSNAYATFSYKDYDESAIVSSTLTAPPALSDVPYTTRQKIDGFSHVENGSRQDKLGVEMEFTSQRIAPLRTAIKLSGAWFRSIYVNSRPMYYTMSSVVGGVTLADSYVGLYDWNDGRINEQLSTSLLLDTQIPEWGLIFSTSLQAMWYVSTRRMPQDGTPTAYLDATDGQLHPYTDEAVANNPLLAHLIYRVGTASFDRYNIPPALYMNLKLTKHIGKVMNLSLFVNKLLDYTPDYRRNGVIIRRNVLPYFGMEANFKI